MAWGDWSASYPGSFEVYSESVIDMTAYMAQKFQNGLLAAGTVQDEINLNAGYAFKRIDRVENDAAGVALAAAKASGRQYDYDENWVYVEREEEVVLDLKYTVSEVTYTLDGEYIANDHGLEMFTNTAVAITSQNLYGQNLKNKLERDVVTHSEDVENDLLATTAGKVLDARQGKALDTKISNRLRMGHITSGTIEASSTKEFSVTFSPAFSATPYVIAVAYGNSSYLDRNLLVTSVTDISTTGCTITVLNPHTSSLSLSGSRRIVYMAALNS